MAKGRIQALVLHGCDRLRGDARHAHPEDAPATPTGAGAPKGPPGGRCGQARGGQDGHFQTCRNSTGHMTWLFNKVQEKTDEWMSRAAQGRLLH